MFMLQSKNTNLSLLYSFFSSHVLNEKNVAETEVQTHRGLPTQGLVFAREKFVSADQARMKLTPPHTVM